tara:strand:- start:101 stop:619 length:519 start_codon:yes stop_codon:yes gene_type:complete
MKKFVTLLSVILFSVNANAGVSLGTSISYFKNNDPVYDYADKPVNSFNIGYNKSVNDFNISLTTNRFLNWGIEKKVKNGNTTFINKTYIDYEAIQLGYRIKRFIPSVLIANVHTEKKLSYNGVFQGKTRNDFIAYGGGLSYIVTKHIITSFNIILPNEEMDFGSSLSINYLF